VALMDAHLPALADGQSRGGLIDRNAPVQVEVTEILEDFDRAVSLGERDCDELRGYLLNCRKARESKARAEIMTRAGLGHDGRSSAPHEQHVRSQHWQEN
jgi:hypothetical protein